LSERKTRVVVLFGGRSGEHEVSCISARHVAAAMDPDRYEVIPIGITKDGRWMLPDASRKVLEGAALELPETAFEVAGEPVTVVQDPTAAEIVPIDRSAPLELVGRPDVVFAVLHGPHGEDGTVQGLMELADIPYVGAGVVGSALGMDKEKMKILFRAAGLPIADFVVIREHEWEADLESCLARASEVGFPCFVKPANLGSSVGITKCRDADELRGGIEEAFRHDRKVLVEEAIGGREIECGVLGNEYPEASVCGEVLPGREFYDYVAKYLDESSRTVIPAAIPDDVSETSRGYSIEAFKAIDAEGMARVDFFYNEGDRGVVVNEINTIPGFTTISMFPKLWEASGVPYAKLIDRLIELALDRHRKKRRPEDLPPPPGLHP
jgi:D-alanine-D-alanine ligase